MSKVPYNKGDEYEQKLFMILFKSKVVFPGITRAGAGGGTDIVLIHKGKRINLEIKKDDKADYGQKMLKWSKERGWYWAVDDEVTRLYTSIGALKHLNDRGIVPIKFNKRNENITPQDKKKDQIAFEDKIQISSNALMKYYSTKNCFYIQVGNGYGFYHLEKDVENLGVPKFEAVLVLRFRAKTIHSKPPWNYGFYAVLKVVSIIKKSKFNLEKSSSQEFPPINKV